MSSSDGARFNMNDQRDSHQVHNATQTAVSVAVIAAIGFLIYVFFAIQTGAWQLYATSAVISGIFIASLLTVRLCRQNRIQAGIWLLLGTIALGASLASVLVADLGLMVGLIVLIILFQISAQTLSSTETLWASILGIAVAIFMSAAEAFSGSIQFVHPLVSPATLIITVVLVLVFGWSIARSYLTYPLQIKLIMGFLVVSFLSVAAVALSIGISARRNLVDTTRDTLIEAASETTTSLDTFFRTNLNNIRVEAELPQWQAYLTKPRGERAGSQVEGEALATLKSLSHRDSAHVLSYALTDRDGVILLDTNPQEIGLNVSEQAFFATPLTVGLPFVSPVEFASTDFGGIFYFSSPVRSRNGEEIIGILRVRYSATILQELVDQSLQHADSQSFGVLLDENYFYLAHSADSEAIGRSVVPIRSNQLQRLRTARRAPNLPAAAISLNQMRLKEKLATAISQPYFTTSDILSGETEYQVATNSLTNQPWLVVYFVPSEVVLAPVELQTRRTVILTLVIAGVVTSLAMFIAQVLVAPIVRLTDVARRVAEGEMHLHAAVETPDEIGQLAGAFNVMTGRLSGLIGNLEDQVQARTTELVLSMAVGQRATAIRELNELLPTISEFIRELFDLYYTQVYFVDDLQQNLVLQFGTGQVGRQLLEQGHQLPIDETSIVGRVALEGKSVVVADTGQNTIHKRNSLLPDTHSELAVPLLVEGKVIGVLDMQARQAEAFTDKNTPVFEAMAVQLSGAIDSARQWDLARRTQTKLEEIVKQYTHDRWEAVLSGRNTDKALGFAYDLVKVRAANEESATAEANRLTTPLIVQNEPVGQLMVEMPPNQRLHEDTQRFLEAVGEQIAQKAETLRLFEEIQQQAGREQLTRHIADRIRSASDIETAMQTATAELAKALGAARAIIDFRLDPDASVEKSANGHGHPTAF